MMSNKCAQREGTSGAGSAEEARPAVCFTVNSCYRDGREAGSGSGEEESEERIGLICNPSELQQSCAVQSDTHTRAHA